MTAPPLPPTAPPPHGAGGAAPRRAQAPHRSPQRHGPRAGGGVPRRCRLPLLPGPGGRGLQEEGTQRDSQGDSRPRPGRLHRLGSLPGRRPEASRDRSVARGRGVSSADPQRGCFSCQLRARCRRLLSGWGPPGCLLPRFYSVKLVPRRLPPSRAGFRAERRPLRGSGVGRAWANALTFPFCKCSGFF